ncbi:hypothetical protein K470DRAFT_255860 [Piedraia hortae CBS 480.64]|uniref:K Homology domain-containing protein n=1 Tax=Piedraia hortae CBS 480.64 TaxID=1314780 RepID=A0A6A7C7B9_9PEZI|nr:hypothetical protein K470DRAFT_255860 [Piedraia hortae CBS 480.64]
MAAPNIASILAALAQGGNATPVQPQQAAYPIPPPSAPPQAHALPLPSNIGSLDLSSIKPVNSGSVNIADAIAKARTIAADRGVPHFDTGSASRDRYRRDYRSRSRSRSPLRRDTYGANPYRDERRDDPRRGSHRRSLSPDRGFRGSRDPPIGYRGGDGETETIRVRSSLVGLIIGRNGENMRRIESDTGARVQFLQARDSHVPERQCTISGSLRARIAAKDAIFQIIEENGGQVVQPDKGAYTPGMPGRAKVNLPALRDGEASTQIMVPDRTVGLIIGRGGETIKDVQEKSGCHVNIVGENKSVNGLRPVNLIGSEAATAKAKELILEIVESDSRDTTAGRGSSSANANATPATRDRGFGNLGASDHVEKTIHVPSEAVGMIIGKGGETIKELQRTSGCKINVHQPSRPDVTRRIDLSGSTRSMEEAERTIWEKVETVQQRDAAAGRGGNRDSKLEGPPSLPQPPQASTAVYGQQYAAPVPSTTNPMTAFQLPMTQPGTDMQAQPDQYAAWALWYAHLANQQQQQSTHQGGAPGTQ